MFILGLTSSSGTGPCLRRGDATCYQVAIENWLGHARSRHPQSRMAQDGSGWLRMTTMQLFRCDLELAIADYAEFGRESMGML